MSLEAQLAALLADDFQGVVVADRAASIAEATGCTVGELLPLLVPFAQRYALPPISSFPVGAVTQGASGSLYLGANMEFAGTALGFTVHAEQSATTNAWLNGEEGLLAIAVSAAPCGYCRQFFNELTTAATLRVVIAGRDGLLLTELLPEPFGPDDLDVTAALMSPQDHGLTLDPAPTDPLVLAALAAANASYAPYSKGFAGVALGTASGAVYSGRYAENAAFNPSMSPLESALTMRALGGADDALTRAVLVEAPSAASQAAAAAVLLEVVAPAIDLEAFQTA